MNKTVANLNDVANHAGVSKSTVSRVLNNKLGNGFSVSSPVKKRIFEAVEHLNYKPNLFARSLTKQRSKMISVLGGAHALRDLGNIYQSVINSITKVFNTQLGIEVIVDMSHHKPNASHLPAWKIDGAIVLAQANDLTFDELNRRGVPCVVINGPMPKTGSCVKPNDQQGTKIAVHHLAYLGHEKIAYANAPSTRLDGHQSMTDRHNTYLSELKNLGLTPIPNHDRPFENPEQFLIDTVKTANATAILCYGHMNALNLMQAAHRLDLSIPDDFSLICFCDEYAANIMSPNISFVDLQSQKMGEIAAEIMLAYLNNSKHTQHKELILDEKLVVRKTTAEYKHRKTIPDKMRIKVQSEPGINKGTVDNFLLT